jgi:hypothetical protein
MDRREFTKYLTALGVGAGMAQIPGLVRHACAAQGKGQIPYRRLGSTGKTVSLVGLGGFHIGKPKLAESESIRIIRTAIDNGINFLDNCWDYNDGHSEIRMGKALRDGTVKRPSS